jgi:hypothetical protein
VDAPNALGAGLKRSAPKGSALREWTNTDAGLIEFVDALWRGWDYPGSQPFTWPRAAQALIDLRCDSVHDDVMQLAHFVRLRYQAKDGQYWDEIERARLRRLTAAVNPWAA